MSAVTSRLATIRYRRSRAGLPPSGASATMARVAAGMSWPASWACCSIVAVAGQSGSSTSRASRSSASAAHRCAGDSSAAASSRARTTPAAAALPTGHPARVRIPGLDGIAQEPGGDLVADIETLTQLLHAVLPRLGTSSGQNLDRVQESCGRVHVADPLVQQHLAQGRGGVQGGDQRTRDRVG